MVQLKKIKDIKNESRKNVFWLKTNLANLCKCGVEKKISYLMELKFQLEKMNVEHSQLLTVKSAENILKPLQKIVTIRLIT